jgi:hypothetical protein
LSKFVVRQRQQKSFKLALKNSLCTVVSSALFPVKHDHAAYFLGKTYFEYIFTVTIFACRQAKTAAMAKKPLKM